MTTQYPHSPPPPSYHPATLAPSFPSVPLKALTGKSYFYFLRHGQSIANRSGIIQGHAESPLSPQGRRQAAAAGRWMRRRGRIDAVRTSPLGRAMETAHIVGRRCGVEPVVHDAVCEIDTGVFSNKNWREVERDHPVACRRFRIESWEAVPQAERIPALMARAAAYWEHLIEVANSGTRRIVTVTHGGMLQWLIKATMGSATWMPLIPAANCAIFMLYARPETYDAAAAVVPKAAVTGQEGVATTTADKAADRAAAIAAASGAVADAPVSMLPDTTDTASVVRGAYSAWQMINFIPY